jgi:hypothetical protein
MTVTRRTTHVDKFASLRVVNTLPWHMREAVGEVLVLSGAGRGGVRRHAGAAVVRVFREVDRETEPTVFQSSVHPSIHSFGRTIM